MTSTNRIFSIACFIIALGIIAGAFGAHGLKDTVTPERLEVFKTAVLYQLLNGLGLLALATSGEQFLRGAKRTLAANLILLGVIIFSGTLYALVLLDLPILGAVTPLGGTLLIIGWVYAGIASIKSAS